MLATLKILGRETLSFAVRIMPLEGWGGLGLV